MSISRAFLHETLCDSDCCRQIELMSRELQRAFNAVSKTLAKARSGSSFGARTIPRACGRGRTNHAATGFFLYVKNRFKSFSGDSKKCHDADAIITVSGKQIHPNMRAWAASLMS